MNLMPLDDNKDWVFNKRPFSCYKRMMASGIKLTLDDCKETAKAKGGLCLSKEYINNRIKMEWECAMGHRWMAKAHELRAGHWCVICAGKRSRTIDEAYTIATIKDGEC